MELRSDNMSSSIKNYQKIIIEYIKTQPRVVYLTHTKKSKAKSWHMVCGKEHSDLKGFYCLKRKFHTGLCSCS